MFKVGDKVRIREWDDMAEQFGTSSIGSINCLFMFTKSMKYLCGQEFVITVIDVDGEVFGFRNWKSRSYTISTDMIKHVPTKEGLLDLKRRIITSVECE